MEDNQCRMEKGREGERSSRMSTLSGEGARERGKNARSTNLRSMRRRRSGSVPVRRISSHCSSRLERIPAQSPAAFRTLRRDREIQLIRSMTR